LRKLLIGLLLSSSFAYGFDYPYLIRSPRALLMGDAFTAVNDDEFTLFYNPASLARHKNDFTIYPLPIQLTGTNVLDDMDKFNDLPNEPVGFSDLLMNYPVHASTGFAPGFKFFNFGLSFFVNESYDLLLRNKAQPMLDIDLRADRGVVMGVGIPLGHRRISRRSRSGSQTSLGLSAKYVERKGLRDTFALTGPQVANALGQDKLSDFMKSFGQIKGIGWGFDAGLEHIVRERNSQFIVGLSALNISGTDFKVAKTPDNLRVANINEQLNFGIAAGENYSLINYLISADVKNLTQQMDFKQRLSLGGQIGIPGFTFMAGINGGLYSYGATVDLAFVRVTGGFYDVELGSDDNSIRSKRFLIYVSLFDFSFDA
jgi:hypothetical protein